MPVAQSADVRFFAETDIVRLAGYTVEPETLRTGDTVAMTLCWEVLAQPANDYAVFIQFIGHEQQAIAKIDTFPGLGKYPTSRWRTGEVFCDRFRITTSTQVQVPAMYDVQIVLYDFENGQRLDAGIAGGIGVDALVLTQLKVVPVLWPKIAIEQSFERTFGDQIALLGYNIETLRLSSGEQVRYTLVWQALTRPPVDYTVFVHLYPASPDGAPDFSRGGVVQQDGQPTAGRYSTRFWDAGEIIEDNRAFDLPATLSPGCYVLVIGLYRLDTMERLLLPDGTSSVSIPEM